MISRTQQNKAGEWWGCPSGCDRRERVIVVPTFPRFKLVPGCVWVQVNFETSFPGCAAILPLLSILSESPSDLLCTEN